MPPKIIKAPILSFLNKDRCVTDVTILCFTSYIYKVFLDITAVGICIYASKLLEYRLGTVI